MPFKSLLSLFAGALVFCLLFFLLSFTLKIAIVIAALIAICFFVVSYAQKKQSEIELFFSGVQDKDLQKVLRDGYEKQQTLKNLRIKIMKPEIRDKLASNPNPEKS